MRLPPVRTCDAQLQMIGFHRSVALSIKTMPHLLIVAGEAWAILSAWKRTKRKARVGHNNTKDEAIPTAASHNKYTPSFFTYPTSMMILTPSRRGRVSPLVRHSMRLSSSKGFNISTHSGSTGPSRITHP